MTHQSFLTQRIANRFPLWSDARQLEHSIFQQLLNPLATEVESLYKYSTDERMSHRLSKANTDLMDLVWIARLPNDFTFGVDPYNPSTAWYTVPKITAELDDVMYTPEVAEDNSLTNMWYNSYPTRIEVTSNTETNTAIISEVVLSGLEAATINAIPSPNYLYITISGGEDFIDISRIEPVCFIILRGTTENELENEEMLIIPFNGVFQTVKVWKELDSIEYYGLQPDTIKITIDWMPFNRLQESDKYMLAVDPTSEKLLYHKLSNTFADGSTHQIMTTEANTIEDLHAGLNTLQVIRDIELGYSKGLATGVFNSRGNLESWSLGVPTGWTYYTSGTCSVAQETTKIKDGSNSAKITLTSAGSSLFYYVYTFAANTTYELSFWYRGDTGGETVAIGLANALTNIWYNFNNDSWQSGTYSKSRLKLLQATDAWQKITLTIDVDATERTNYILAIGRFTTDVPAGVYYVDDFRLSITEEDSETFFNIDLKDLAVQPFTGRMYGMDDYYMYIFEPYDSLTDCGDLRLKTDGANLRIDVNDGIHYLRGDTVTFSPYWAIKTDKILRTRWSMIKPDGTTQYLLLDGTPTTASLAWVANEAGDELAFGPFVYTDGSLIDRQSITYTLSSRGTYKIVLESYYSDGATQKDMVPIQVHYKEAVARIDLPYNVQGNTGLAFDYNQKLWLLSGSTATQIELHTDNLVIDQKNKALICHEQYDTVTVYQGSDVVR